MKVSILILMVMFYLGGMAQDKSTAEMRYIFSGHNYRVSGFGGSIMEFSVYDGDFAFYSGGGGAVIFNNTFFIGGYGMSMACDKAFHPIYNTDGSIKENDLSLSVGYGGLWIGYIFKPNDPIHFGISSKFGGGAATLIYNDFEYTDYDYHMDYIGIIAPQVELEMNLARWFKINIGVGYRFVTGVSNASYIADTQGNMQQYFSKKDFSAPYGNISLLFGGFGPKSK